MTFPSRTLLLITFWACFVWIQVECNPTGANTNLENEKQGSQETQTGHQKVAALDRFASFGDIYDATTDTMWPMSIVKENVPNEAIRQTNSSHSSIQLIGHETLKERMRKLDIQPSQFISLLLGLSAPSDARKYLERFAPIPRTAKASLVYKFRTVVESFDPFSNASLSIYDPKMLEISEETHFVVGREYGSDLVLTLKKKCTSNAIAKEVQKQLEADIQSIIEYVSGNGTDPSSNRPNWHKFGDFDLSTDFKNDTVPLSISDAISIIKKFPNQLNGEKGKIKAYILEPLQNIRARLDIQSNSTGVAKQMDPELIDKLLKVFQELEDSSLLINDLYEEMTDWDDMFAINSSELEKISDIKSDFDDYKYDLKVDLKSRIVGFRRGKVESEMIKELISSHENGNWTAAKINNTILNDFRSSMIKIDLMNLFRVNGAKFLDKGAREYRIIGIKSAEKKIGLLSVDLNMNISSPYVQDIVKLLESSKASDAAEYYIKDVAVERPTVEVYSKGKKIETILVGKE